MATSDAPISIGAVTLRVNDLSKVADFYRQCIGLDMISHSGEEMTLGVQNNELLVLQEHRYAKRRPAEPGLFHTAFLLPKREDLGAWLRNAADSDVKLDGMSDHSVSEAIYLDDPEGNGVEVYVDRDRSHWAMDGTRPKLHSKALDVKGLLDLSDNQWHSAPGETVIGHVHLQVGGVEEANDFYSNTLGFDIMTEMPHASFYGSGGYHHHIAANTWNTQNAGKRSEGSTGLVQVDLLSKQSNQPNGSHEDPWGITVNVPTVH